MKVIIGMMNHETNTFSTTHTDINIFKQLHWSVGEESLKAISHGNGDYLGGIADTLIANGVEVVPTMACVQSSGVITKECYETILNNFLSTVKANLDADGVCIALHGAGVSEVSDDFEGDILRETRKLMKDKPIYACFDLHGNISDQMVESADGIFAIKEYPHTDSYAVASKMASILIENIKNKRKIYTSFIRLPLNICPATAPTNIEPAKSISQFTYSLEKGNVIHAGFFNGFPYADIEFMRSSVVVLSYVKKDGDEAAKTLANFVWGKREQFLPKYFDAKGAIDEALKKEGMVVVNDSSDNPGGGTPGDGTYLLREMIERNIPKTVFGYIGDKQTVEKAVKSGVGTYISCELGGKTIPIHGDPIKIEKAYVKCITDGKFVLSTPMYKGVNFNLGTCARLVVGNVDIIVSTIPYQTFDEEIFRLHGIDVTEYKIVALKGSQHFKARFCSLTDSFVTADTPGIGTNYLERLPYKITDTNFYPINKNIEFEA